MSTTSSWVLLSQDSNNDNKGPKLVLMFISFAASVAIFFVILCCRHLLRRWRHHRRISTAPIPRDSPKPELAPSSIASLPTFAYQEAADPTGNATSARYCAVCLGQAQEGEMVRLLPKCKHVFHVECIDMWLYSHSTCPLCRSNVVDSPKVVEKVEGGEESAPPELPV